MLGRTANNVYWMARYVERAENLARLLASTYHMSLLPAASGNDAQQWEAPLQLAGDREDFLSRYREINPGNVLSYMALDVENEASIRSCIRLARENARATRPELTTEVWEGLNETFIELERMSYNELMDRGFREFFDWVKERSHLFRGAIYGTMRRGDAFTFSRLGTFIERADNTARFLAIKWDMLSPSGRPLAAEDYYRWGALLRAFSAFKAYREVYSGIIDPRRVAELLVLRGDMPRSLIACTHEVMDILRLLRGQATCTRLSIQIHERLQRNRIDGILRTGLPRFLNGFIARNNELHGMIGQEFMLVLWNLSIEHETHYRFGEPAHHSIQYLRLTPRGKSCQLVHSWQVSTPGKLKRWTDGFGNIAHVSVQNGLHDELPVTVRGEVETFDTFGVLSIEDGLPPPMFLHCTRFTKIEGGIEALASPFAERVREEGAIAALHGLMWAIHNAVDYRPGLTTVESTAAEALEQGSGVCQDHAHLFIACCRVLHIPARYVSGYLFSSDDNKGSLASHAWAEAYVDDLGWVSFDPSNGQSATEAYVRLAVAFDYAGASPIRGIRKGGGTEEMTVRVEVSSDE